MTRPGERLRALAVRLCMMRSVERFIDPAVADLQYEYAGAVRQQRHWRARWIHLAGAIRLVQVLASCFVSDSWRAVTATSAVGPAIVAASISVGIGLAFAALLLANSYSRSPLASPAEALFLLTLLMPASIPVSLPCGVCVGAMLWQRRRGPATRTLRPLMLVAWVCALLMLIVVGWVSPETNQLYRTHVAGEMGASSAPVRGANELSFPALITRARGESIDTGFLGSAAHADTLMSLHVRLSVLFSPVLFALFGAFVARRGPITRVLTIGTVYGAFVAIAMASASLLNVHSWPPMFAAWLPDGFVSAALIGVMYMPDKPSSTVRSEPRTD